MAAPILFNDWAGERWKEGALRSYALLSHLGLVVSVAGIALALIFAGPLTRIVFGDKFVESVASTRILLFGLFPFYQNRLLSPISLAVGYPSATAISSLIRTIVVLAILYFAFASSLVNTALAWVIGEFVCMLYMCGVVSLKTGWPVTQVAGISPSWVFGKIKSIQWST
jgi:O-antigen/teichoic acid export membrane protein